MPSLPVISARQMRQTLNKLGFIERRQTGSHLIFRHPITRAMVTVPMHRGDLKPGTLRSILKQASISVEQLSELL